MQTLLALLPSPLTKLSGFISQAHPLQNWQTVKWTKPPTKPKHHNNKREKNSEFHTIQLKVVLPSLSFFIRYLKAKTILGCTLDGLILNQWYSHSLKVFMNRLTNCFSSITIKVCQISYMLWRNKSSFMLILTSGKKPIDPCL
jgi:hypothetical protein